MHTYNYELAPPIYVSREERNALKVSGSFNAKNYDAAVSIANAKASALSKADGREYDVATLN